MRNQQACGRLQKSQWAGIVGLRFSMIVDDGAFRHQHGLEIKKFALN
ncbi:hypothetical protein [Tardiphaga robiniae]|nr:hypothetical protein [Tardiphaga robiniae]